MLKRRLFTAGVLAAPFVRPAVAQSWAPSGPIKMIVAYPAGGPADGRQLHHRSEPGHLDPVPVGPGGGHGQDDHRDEGGTVMTHGARTTTSVIPSTARDLWSALRKVPRFARDDTVRVAAACVSGQ